MNLNSGVVFLLVSSLLFAVAVVVHFHSSHLSLPIAPVVTFITALLPILSFLNAFVYPSLLQAARSSLASRIQQISPAVLQALQVIITTVLATFLLEGTISSVALNCVLDNQWMRMFRAQDGESIRLIQDTLNCCGLNSVKDRAYPFPHGSSGKPSPCAETYGRTMACKQPWRAAMQSSAGVDFGVVVAVGLMQMLGLLMMREGASWWTSWRSLRRQHHSGRRESNRPLLTAVAEVDEEVAEESHPQQRSYGSLPEGENRPRVEPSPIHSDRNAWNDDAL